MWWFAYDFRYLPRRRCADAALATRASSRRARAASWPSAPRRRTPPARAACADFFFTASQLGTAVVSVQVLLHTPHARTHPTHYEYSNKPTTTLRLEDRVLEEITGTIHGAVDDGHVVLPLWLHTWEAADVK